MMSHLAAPRQDQFRDSASARQALGVVAEVVNGMRDRGELSPETEALLAAADQEAEHDEAMARAHESFANCMAGI